MRLIDADKLIEELEELEEYFENESNRPDDGLANPQRYRDTMSGVTQGLNHAITVVLDVVATVEAIPVEWIKHWCIKNYPTYPRIITEELLKKTETWQMIEDWEKENETNGRR